MKKFLAIVLFGILTYPAFAGERVPAADFAKANAAYRDGKYSEAIEIYQAMISSGYESGSVFYNLGNSYFKNKQLGKAIVNYERAQKFSPRDSDLAANLKFALSSVPTKVDPVLSFVDKIFSGHVRFYSVNEMVFVLSLLAGALAIAHLCGLYFNWPGCRWAMGIFGVLFLIFIVGLMVKINLEKDAAIVIKATAARFEPSDKATVYFELPEGQKVRWQIIEGDWLRIKRPDEKVGWVPLQTIEKI